LAKWKISVKPVLGIFNWTGLSVSSDVASCFRFREANESLFLLGLIPTEKSMFKSREKEFSLYAS
jgi:hypothetical protein